MSHRKNHCWLILAFTVLLMPHYGFNQTTAAHSQQDWQDLSLTDTVRLELLDSMIRKVHWQQQPDSSFYYIGKMAELARQAKHNRFLHLSLKRKASLFKYLGDYVNVIISNQERIQVLAIADYPRTERLRNLASAHQNLAYASRKLGQTTASLAYYETSLKYAEQLGEEGRKEKANVLNSWGSLYLNRKEYELALDKYTAALALYQESNYRRGIYSALNNLGLLAANMGDYQQALQYYEQSLVMKRAAGDQKRIANTLGSIGDILILQNQTVAARDHFLQAKALQEELGLRDELARSYSQLGQLAIRQDRPAEALQWCEQSCSIATEDQLWQAELDCRNCLYLAHKALGNSAQALAEHEAYAAIKDAVFNANNASEIANVEARLTYENQLAKAEVERLRLQSQTERERLMRWIFFVAACLLALFSWFALSRSRLKQRQNKVLRTINDQITKDRELIRQQSQQLAETANVKDRFFTNISHELRTPLTLVSSPLAQLLRQPQALPEHALATLHTVKNNADKLLQLVEELLELSQLEAGTATVELSPLTVPPFVQQVFSNYQSLARAKNIQYKLQYTTGPLPKVQTDVRRLEKIIDNILGNALKFTPTGGHVLLVVAYEDHPTPELRIQVIDNGPGISPKDLPLVFDRYYRADTSQANSSGGTGIGLALAQESAHLLGGVITVESTPNQGSTFTLQLPATIVHEPAEASASPSATVTAPQATTSKTRREHAIMIVEDNPELQAFLGQVLSAHRCVFADNGQEALRLLQQAQSKQQPIELVITDLTMPQMDGTTLIKKIRANDELSTTRCVVLTARHSLSDRLTLLRIGVDDYLTKPFSPEELLLRVNNLLQYPIVPEPKDTSIAPSEASTPPAGWLAEVEQLVISILDAKQELTASSLASKLHLSNRQLLRKIKAQTGMSTQLYLQECKLQLAYRYLAQQQMTTVADIAKACGFNTLRYFNQVFENRFGKNPADFL